MKDFERVVVFYDDKNLGPDRPCFADDLIEFY